MTTERDELTDIIATNRNEYANKTADRILAAGYSKHSSELAKAMRGARTLGEIIEKQCRDVLDITGLHHLINEDGDGAWDVVWMRLFEMREELASLKESTIGRERLRGDKWRDRAQAMEVSRDAAVAELADRDEKLARVEAIEKRLERSKQCEDREIAEDLRAAVAAANGGGE